MTADELIDAANSRRSVTGFHWHTDKPMPAAFLIGMPFRLVMRALPRLKVYVKPHKWREPRALLPERAFGPPFPKQFDVVSYRIGDGYHKEATVYANLGDMLYCQIGWGTAFIPADRVEEIIYEPRLYPH